MRPKLKYLPKFREDRVGVIVFFDINTPPLVTNQVGRAILEGCDGEKTLEQIAKSVSERYNESYEKVFRDTKQFLDELKKGGLLISIGIKFIYVQNTDI